MNFYFVLLYRLKKSKYKSALEKLGKQRQAKPSRALRAKNKHSRRKTSESESDTDDPKSRDSDSSDSSSRKKSRHSERPSKVSTRQKPDKKSSKLNLANEKSPSNTIEISSGSDFEDPKPTSKQSMKKVQEKKNKKVVHSDQSSSDDNDSDFKVTKKRGNAQDSSSEEARPSRKKRKSVKSKPARRVPSVGDSTDSSDEEENEPRKRKTQGKKKKVSSEESDAQPRHRTKPKSKKQDDSGEDRNKIKSKNSNEAKNKDRSQSTKKKQESQSESSGDGEEENKSKRLVSPVIVTSKQSNKHQEKSNKSRETSTKKTTSEKHAESVENMEPCTSTGAAGELDGDMDSDATSKDGDSDASTPKLEWLGGLISEFARVAKENNGKISQLKEQFSDNMKEEDVHDACKIIYKQVKKSMKFLDDYKSNIINDYTDWKRKGERRKQQKTKTKRLQSQSERVSNDLQNNVVLKEPTTSADKLSKKKRKVSDEEKPDDTVSDQVESEEEQSSVEVKGKDSQKRNVTFAEDTSNNSLKEKTPAADDDEDWEKKIEEDTGKNNRKDKTKSQSKIDKGKKSKKKKENSEDESHTEDEQLSERSVDEEEAPAADDSQVSVDKDSSEATRPASLNSSKDGSSETAVKNSLATLEEEAAKLREQLSSEKLDLLSKTLDSKHGRASIDPFSECDFDSSIQDKSTVCGDDVAQEILEERQDVSDTEKGIELSPKVVGEEKSQNTQSKKDNSHGSKNSETTHFEGDKSVDSQRTVLAEADKSKEKNTLEDDFPQETDSCLDQTTQEFLKDTGEESIAETPGKGNGKATRDSVATDVCGSSDSEHDMDVSALISEAGSDSDARKEDEECRNALIASSTDEEADSETLASSQKSTPKKKRIGPKSKVHRNESGDEEGCPSPTKNKIGPKSKVPGSKGETNREQSLRKSKEWTLADSMITNIDEFSSDRKLSSRCSVTLDVLPAETTGRSRQKRTRRQSGYSSDQEIQK